MESSTPWWWPWPAVNRAGLGLAASLCWLDRNGAVGCIHTRLAHIALVLGTPTSPSRPVDVGADPIARGVSVRGSTRGP